MVTADITRHAATNRTARTGGVSTPIDTTPPSAPSNPAAVGASGAVNLSWAYVVEADPGVAVNIYRGTVQGGSKAPIQSNVTGTSASDATAVAGTTYYYQFAALDSRGNESALSSEVSGAATVASPDSLTLGTMVLTPTYNSIGIRLPYTLDSDNSASILTEFKRTNTADAWRTAFPLWRSVPGTTGRAFHGSLPGILTAGTNYTVRVTITDPGGVIGQNPYEATADTWTDAIADPATLVPTHYVATTGNNANNGTSALTAWQTLDEMIDRANAATGPMVIHIANGYYQRSTKRLVGNGQPITILAETLAIDAPTADDWAPVAAGAHVVIYDRYSSPSGSSDSGSLGAGGWTETSPGSHVWTKDAGISNVMHLGYSTVSGGNYAAAKAALPLKVSNWARQGAVDATTGATLSTAAGFISLVTTNRSYAAGHYQASGSTTLYLRLPGNLDPNNCYIWIGGNTGNGGVAGLSVEGDNIRVCGIETRTLPCGGRMWSGADRPIWDRCLFHGSEYNMHIRPKTGTADVTRFTIQYCRFSDNNMWVGDPASVRGIPWRFIKQDVIQSNDSQYGNRTGARSETQGVKMIRGGAAGVIRYCTFDGPFNGVGSQADNTDVTTQCNIDIHDCLMTNIADNGIEPEGVNVNWRVWNVRMEDSRSLVSSDFSYGPLFIIRCSTWRIGVQGITDDGHSTSPSKGGNGQTFKMGTPDVPSGLVVVVHNTFWSNETGTRGLSSGITGNDAESWYLRNNIYRQPERGFELLPVNPHWDEDYNVFVSTATDEGVQWHNIQYNSASVTGPNSLEKYREASSGGAHTNKHGTAGADASFISASTLDALLTDPTNGDLTLKAGTNPLVGAGVLVPSINDLSGDRDIGAFER